MGAFDEARDVRHNEALVLVYGHDTEVWYQGRERIVGDLGTRVMGGGAERRWRLLPAPLPPSCATWLCWTGRSSGVAGRWVAPRMPSPPFPPSPPSGPPCGTCFSRRKLRHPFPPSPAFT